MKIELPGIILFTENYQACVAFYHEVIGLPLLFSKPTLTCLNFGGAYLMIESGGASKASEKNRSENPTVVRLNVQDVESAAAELHTKGVSVTVQHFGWGVIGTFSDPDGNGCELKDHSLSFQNIKVGHQSRQECI